MVQVQLDMAEMTLLLLQITLGHTGHLLERVQNLIIIIMEQESIKKKLVQEQQIIKGI